MNPTLRRVFLASLLRRRLASALSLLAIALGVALGLAVQLIHGAALDEFGRGLRVLAGEAELQVVGPRAGFDEALYPLLALRPEVAEASPLLEVEASLPGREASLAILGADLFQLAEVQPALLPEVADDGAAGQREPGLAALRSHNVFLSDAAREALSAPPADGEAGPVIVDGALLVQSGLATHRLLIAGSLPGAEGRLGLMDIAGAQQVFDRLGVLSRIDLKLATGVGAEQAIAALSPLLPAGVSLRRPEAGRSEAAALSRAYRVNLGMLAAIALLTGGFLVFSTQLLSVARRRREFALLRALGLPRARLLRGLLIEGAALGLAGGLLGAALGHGLAWTAFRFVGGDLGAGYFRGVEPVLAFEPLLAASYVLLGVAAGAAGSWAPARAAARIAPARALRAGAGERGGPLRPRSRGPAALAALGLAVPACLLPPAGGLPLGGYAAVALILAAAVLALPAVAHALLPLLGRGRAVAWRLARARLQATPGQAVVAGAGVLASVALAAAMAIMVSSFRNSVDDWLAQLLRADLYLRASPAAASGFLDEAALARIAAVPGVAAVGTTRLVNLRIDDSEPLFSLLAREVRGGWGLPLVAGALAPPPGSTLPPAWVSEAAADRRQLKLGDRFELPLAGRLQAFVVAGIWRDYARQHGAVLIERRDYVALTGDRRINDAAIRVAAGADPREVAAALRAAFGADRVRVVRPGEIRAITLGIFDRTFLITYLMEAVAIVIGLFGVATTFATLATTREGEFGMLRHLGLTRGEIRRLIALEGALTAALGVLAGLVAGGAIAWVLVEVVNRQSFHWSMDLAVPWGALALFAAGMVALAALVAQLAGARAMRQSAVRAVKEDW
jgi:putative ABC transport system permease protein